MRTKRLLGLSVALALLISLITVPSANAASSITSAPAPEVALVDLAPGGTVNFTGTVSTAPGETPSNVQVGMDFGGEFAYSGTLAPAAGTSDTFIIAVSTDMLIAHCTNGAVSFIYWNTNESTQYGPISYPCSVVQSVTPVLPTVQNAVCGPDNDEIVIPAQPEGIVTTDSGWANGIRTISFTAEPGYVLEGTASVQFTDAATACPTETPVPTTPAPEPTSPVEVPTSPAVVPPEIPAAPAPVVTSLPATGSGTEGNGALIVLGTLALVAFVGITGMYRRIRQ